MKDGMRLVVISNRLPLSLYKDGDGWKTRHSSGGLVTALGPVIKDRGGLWIGWTGTAREDLSLKDLKIILGPASREIGYRLIPILLNREEVDNYYHGFSNEIIWPLFHDLQNNCYFYPPYWKAYNHVNSIFAGIVRKHTTPEDFLWVNDYHLIPLARSLKEKGVHRNCFFFLHITFPPRDILLKLPWREELVKDLMEYRLIGFQTWRDRRNFIDCLRIFDPSTKVKGRGPVVSVEAFGRTVKVASLPISIDYDKFAELADSPKARQRIREIRADFTGRSMLLGVDRLDYTKGIPQKLQAFRTALENYPELKEKISLLQILVPSREDVPAYQELKRNIEQLISRINGEFSTSGWVPVRYVHRSIPREELVAIYRAADMAIVTSLKDGMNLVSKEYCACHTNNDGVLILSEFAGSASQLKKNALLVNPYDREGVASAILRAFSMTEKEKYNRMSSMRRSIRKRDVFWWVNNFLRASMGRELHDFPEREMAPLLPQGRV